MDWLKVISSNSSIRRKYSSHIVLPSILHRCVTDNTYIMQKQWIHGLSMHHRRDSYTPLSDADNGKPVLFPAYISNTDNLCWNCLVTNGYINGEQIPRASSAFFALSVDFFDVVSTFLITVLDFAAFLNHCDGIQPTVCF